MKNWFNKNYKTIIIAAFLVPIITVAIVSISHVTLWYGISNPVTWAVYLSIGIEIAALSALAAISADMGSKVYFPFSVVTLIQFIGNIFFAYSFIDINSQSFKDWVDLVSPLVSFMGVEPTDFVGHKRFLAFFAGGMLPVISLSFLHMLIKFTEEDKQRGTKEPEPENKIDASDIISEVSRVRLSENDLKILEEALLNPPPPNEALVDAAKKYKEMTDEEILKKAEQIKLQRTWDIVTKITEDREKEFGPTNPEDEPVGALANSEYREKLEQRNTLVEMMKSDEELGLYDEPIDAPLFPKKIEESKNIIKNSNLDEVLKQYEEDWGGLSNEELIGDDEIQLIQDTYNIANAINETPVTPALGDDEVREMFMDEWERKFDLVEEEYIPTDEDVRLNEELNSAQNETISEPVVMPQEVQKFNIDDSYPKEDDFKTIENLNNNDSFWRDHLNEDGDDIKKK